MYDCRLSFPQEPSYPNLKDSLPMLKMGLRVCGVKNIYRVGNNNVAIAMSGMLR